jgi:hypothetical protein
VPLTIVVDVTTYAGDTDGEVTTTAGAVVSGVDVVVGGVVEDVVSVDVEDVEVLGTVNAAAALVTLPEPTNVCTVHDAAPGAIATPGSIWQVPPLAQPASVGVSVRRIFADCVVSSTRTVYAVATGDAVHVKTGRFVVIDPIGLRSVAGSVYTTVTDLDVTLPALSRAVTFTVLMPSCSCTMALHDVVPIAVPPALPFVHVTLLIPLASELVPSKAIAAVPT